MSLIENLAQIRELQGKEPLPNPHIIAGFEPGSPPVPEYRPMQPTQAEDPFGLDDDVPAAPERITAPQSPLIPRKPAPPPAEAPLEGPVFNLTVGDKIAGWKGRGVILSVDEEKQIRAVVLKALRRELDADLSDAGVKRTRRTKAAPEAVSGQPAKRRGRPRKVQP